LAPQAVATTSGLLKRGRTVIESRVVGSSMAPTLAAGDRVRIRCGASPPELGQVVAWVAGDAVVTHRVVWTWPTRRHVMTRGDGTALPDPPIPEDLVLGVVGEVFRRGAWYPIAGLAVRDGRAKLGALLEVAFRMTFAVAPWLPRVMHALLYGSSLAVSWPSRLRRRNRSRG
jgi:hypothetical protein